MNPTGFYAGYEFTKRHFQKSLGVEALPVWATLTSGAVGGVAYWTAWYVGPCASSTARADFRFPPRSYPLGPLVPSLGADALR